MKYSPLVVISSLHIETEAKIDSNMYANFFREQERVDRTEALVWTAAAKVPA
jgi:hypothetical protein